MKTMKANWFNFNKIISGYNTISYYVILASLRYSSMQYKIIFTQYSKNEKEGEFKTK